MLVRKKILFLANRVPFPPDKGDKIRTFHQMEHLAASHDVYCACFVDSPEEACRAKSLRRWCRDVLTVPWDRQTAMMRAIKGWLGGRSLSVGAYADERMSQGIQSWCEAISFDVALAFASNMAAYALESNAPRRILDLCDVDSAKWRAYAGRSRFPASWVYASEARRLRAYEKSCLSDFDAVMVITNSERALLDPIHERNDLFVVSNGVALPARSVNPAWRCAARIGFCGAMDYLPNIDGVCWFVREAWPLIRDELPDAEFVIAGRNPTQAVRGLAKCGGVRVLGYVEDMNREIEGWRLSVAPLRIARGLQNKVLEAMAMRRPVVATSQTAEGLHVVDDHNILIADEPREIADQVIRLCELDGLCRRIGDAAYRCVASYYSWTEALTSFEQIVLGSIAREADVAEVPPAPEGDVYRSSASSTHPAG